MHIPDATWKGKTKTFPTILPEAKISKAKIPFRDKWGFRAHAVHRKT